jgi:glycosyltransferase involved in cell wall biosynthesis
MNAAMKSIFLVNPISGRGHLDAYARLYSRALAELGYRVVLVAESDADVPGYLARNAVAQRDVFSFVSFAQAMVAKDIPSERAFAGGSTTVPAEARAELGALRRAQLVWREDGSTGILRRLVILPPRFAWEFMLKSVRSESARAALVGFRRRVLRGLVRYRLARALGKFFYPDTGRIRFEDMVQHVWKAGLLLKGSPPDLVLFLYLDLMGEAAGNLAVLDSARSAPWVGILFHPRLANFPEATIERYFASKNARGAIFLVPAAVDIYAKAAPRLKFPLLPDIADLEVSAELPRIAREMRDRAAGRKIVLQVGSIAPHKGVMTLLDVIAQADAQRFFFSFVGEVHWQSFGANEKRLREFYARPPENVYVHEGYLQEERDYNALIAACDVIYAVYSGFNSSSNSLAKAAGLRRPILATKGTLMGERVSAAAIGGVVRDGDVREVLAAIDHLVTRPPESFGFDAFAQQYSLEKLKSVLADAVPGWLAEPMS